MSTLTLQAIDSSLIALAIVALIFIAFIREDFPPEVIALSGAAALLSFQILPYDRALIVLANPVPWTIAAMFIVVSALVRTGVLNSLTQFFSSIAEKSPARAITTALGFIACASAIMNNTPLIIVMIPVFIQLSHTLECAPSKLLIPLSYMAIIGGNLTLLGTSTHRLVDDIATSSGLRPFTVLEIFPIGIVLAVWVSLYLYLFAGRFLPERTQISKQHNAASPSRFFSRSTIPHESDLIGQSAQNVPLFQDENISLIDLIRQRQSLRHRLHENVTLQQGDVIVLQTTMANALTAQSHPQLESIAPLSTVSVSSSEVLVTPNCGILGRRIGELNLTGRYGVYPISVHRRTTIDKHNINQVTLRVGDSLLLEGAQEDIERLSTDFNLNSVSHSEAQSFRRKKAPIAIAALLGIALLTTLNVAPLLLLSILAAAVVLITGCVDSQEAFASIDGRLLALVFSMLGLSAGLESSGAVTLIATYLSPILAQMDSFFIVLTVFVLTNAFTEFLSNNAVAVIMAPIAIAIAAAVGVDPRPLVATVMIAASASFSTPIGYQTNTLIYGPGGYKFSDFVKFGLPLNLTLAPLLSFLIPFIWPLFP